MPAASLLTLIDDITIILDDVWVMTKLSAKKTAGVLGDDLALNAEQAVGLHPERELPVIFAVAQGSARNKMILIPAALALRSLAPWLIQPLLMLGGLFLCFEGMEKLLHKFVPSHTPQAAQSQSEEEKIAGAVRTDFVLSAEILALTLGVAAELDLLRVFLVLVAISILMTVGVYGLVALIVKLDDIGLAFKNRPQAWKRSLGMAILAAAPRFLALISWLGTIAIFCVGGGILAHGIAPLHPILERFAGWQVLLAEGGVGLVAGFLAVGVVGVLRRLSLRWRG
jgi:predicted DNA repair protein MutK